MGAIILWSKTRFWLLQRLLNQIKFKTSDKGDCEAHIEVQFLTTAQWEPLQLVWVYAADLHTPLIELVLWTGASAEDLVGLVFFLAQCQNLRRMETFETILSLCFLFRWFMLLYSTAVAYSICHFIFRKRQTENGDFR